MQDGTHGVSVYVFQSRIFFILFNTRSKIIDLQFGSEKCKNTFVGKRHDDSNIFVDSEVHIWEDKLFQDEKNGNMFSLINI